MRHTRTLRLLAALGVGFILASFVPHAANSQEDEFIPGSGQSYAQIYRAGPTAGRLSLAPVFGLSLADYLNTVGRGETKFVDWAGIGVAERSLPDNTPALKVSSNDPGASEGKTVYAAGESDGGNGGGAGEMFARATKDPKGESRVRYASMGVPGLAEARDTEARTSAGIIKTAKGEVRVATANTDISALLLGGGAVVLRGLHWQTIQKTGAEESITGTFTIDGATVGGLPIAFPGGSNDLKSALGPINTAMAPTGFAVSAPEVSKSNGQANVSPLSIDIMNSPAGRQFLAPQIEALRPVREPTADLFIDLAKQLAETNEEVPDATVAVLGADLAIGIFSGSSQLHLEFGGVASYTEGEVFENPFSGAIDFNPPTVVPPQTVFTPGTPGRPGTPGTAGNAGDDTVSGDFASAPIPAGTRTIPGDKGGVALAVGLIGLAAAIGLAVADWYRMRASRRLAEV